MRVGKLVCFGRGGHTIEYGNGATCYGYDKPDTWEDEGECEGAWALNKRDAVETPEGFRWALRGPMVDVDLKDGQVDALDLEIASPLMVDAVSQHQPSGAVISLQKACKKPGPLDRVSISQYIEGWLEHGAELGKVIGGKVVWCRS